MGKRHRGTRGRSAQAKQRRWDQLTLQHVYKFIIEAVQDRVSHCLLAEDEYWRQKLKDIDWIRNYLISCNFDDEGVHAHPTSPLAKLPRHVLEATYAFAYRNVPVWSLWVNKSQSAAADRTAVAECAAVDPASSWVVPDSWACSDSDSWPWSTAIRYEWQSAPCGSVPTGDVVASSSGSELVAWDAVGSAAVATAVDATTTSSEPLRDKNSWGTVASILERYRSRHAGTKFVEASQVCSASWSGNTSGIGLNKITTPDEMSEAMGRWMLKRKSGVKLLPLPPSSSDSEDEQPPGSELTEGDIATRLHDAMRKHVESKCTQESVCEHAAQLVLLEPRLRLASTQVSFDFDPKCCGNPWSTHVLQTETQITKGRAGENILLTKYKIDVRKWEEHPICDRTYVQRTLAQFFRTRNISLDRLKPAMSDDDEGWFSFAFKSKLVVQSLPLIPWIETAFHAFPMECLASVITHGLQPSSADRSGCRFETPGLYLLKGRDHSAASYSRFVADGAGIFFRCTMECQVDRNRLIPCKRQGQWLQPVGSWATVALWVQAVPYEKIVLGEYMMPAWFPLLEVPTKAGFVC